jgi:hypothetical protein
MLLTPGPDDMYSYDGAKVTLGVFVREEESWEPSPWDVFYLAYVLNVCWALTLARHPHSL